jgi:hypothetical protein
MVAAQHSHFACLKYLREIGGFAWSDTTIKMFTSFKCFEYAYLNKCPGYDHPMIYEWAKSYGISTEYDDINQIWVDKG